MPNGEQYTEAEVIEALKASGGFISTAAERLGCTAQMVYNYINRYPNVKQA